MGSKKKKKEAKAQKALDKVMAKATAKAAALGKASVAAKASGKAAKADKPPRTSAGKLSSKPPAKAAIKIATTKKPLRAVKASAKLGGLATATSKSNGKIKPTPSPKSTVKVPPLAAKRPAPTAIAPILAAKSTLPPVTRPQVRAATQKPEKKLIARAPAKPIVLTPDYRPSDAEPFMSDMHRAYFRQKLLNWKDEIIRQTKETLVILHEDSVQHADMADRATSETDRSLELRARDRQRKLISKIDAALSRIEDGSYGYCEDTGEPIGLKRLEARPIATLSLEAQERHERREKVYRED